MATVTLYGSLYYISGKLLTYYYSFVEISNNVAFLLFLVILSANLWFFISWGRFFILTKVKEIKKTKLG